MMATARGRTGCGRSGNGAWPAHARPTGVEATASATWDVTELPLDRGCLLLVNAKNGTLVEDEW